MSSNDKKHGIKDEIVYCDTPYCGESLRTDHTGIVCPQDHNICPGCTVGYVKSILDDGIAAIPPKCPFCIAEVTSLSFERQLDEKQRANYLMLLGLKSIGKDEVLSQCPSCSYFEVWPNNHNGMTFLYCKNDNCKRVTCYYCKGQCIIPKDGGYNPDEIDKPESTSFIYHEICGELGPYKSMIENAIQRGTGGACPSCGHKGRKDDACNHIRCINCHDMYCYVCGLSEANCDKEDPAKDIYSHNTNWHNNAKRCPMYLFLINEVDDRWSEDGDECLDFLSRINTIKYLKQAIDDMGFPLFERLQKKYDSIKNCGFTIDEIMNTNTTVIIRPNRRR